MRSLLLRVSLSLLYVELHALDQFANQPKFPRMATAAFKSTSKRLTTGGRGTDDSRSSNSRNSNSDLANTSARRRSRSVSRFSHRLPVELVDSKKTPAQAPRVMFVNTINGSEFPEVSLDDLAIDLFSSGDFGSSDMEVGIGAEQRRGRSVSRKEGRVGELTGDGDVGVEAKITRLASDATSRRRRPLSVARYQASDSETDGHFVKLTNGAYSKTITRGNGQTLQMPAASPQQRGLQRCASQRDMFKAFNDYSGYSSLTDDEARDAWYHSDGVEKTLRNRHMKADDFSLRDELRHAVDKTRLGLEQVRISSKPLELIDSGDLRLDSDVLQAVSTMKRSYTTELEQSDKCKQELLAEIMLQQRGKELQNIVGGLLPDVKETAGIKRTSWEKKRRNDGRRISKQPLEDADKIIEDFISSVEDTDISSFDGERSDSSSFFGITAAKPKDMMQFGETESCRSAASAWSDFQPIAADGVVLPWLEWDTSNDGSPLTCRDETQVPATPNTGFQDLLEDASMVLGQVQGAHSTSSCGSWSPGLVESFSIDSLDIEPHSRKSSQLLSNIPRKPLMDIDYSKTASNEECLVERWKRREQISSGMLLICHSSFGPGLI